MTKASGVGQEKESSKLPSSCPYLGLQSDPQTHVGVPDARNFCNLVELPKSVRLSHQEKYCLKSAYLGCEVYIRSGELPLPAGIFEAEGDGRQFTPPLIPLAWTRKRGKQSVAAEGAEETNTTPALDRTPLAYTEVKREERTRTEGGRPRKLRIGLIFALAILLLVAIIVGWNVYSRLQYSRLEYEQAAQNVFTDGLATAIQGVGIVADDWGTAIVVMENPTWTPTPSLAATSTSAQISPGVAGTTTLNPTPTGTPPVCQDIPSIGFQIVSGPDFDPQVGVLVPIYRFPDLTQAKWILKNTGSCSWTDILLWSAKDSEIITPVIKRGDRIINSDELQGNPIAVPGEEITIVLEFPVVKLRNFSIIDEWTLVVNGISLSQQPKLIINAKNWVIILQPTETSTRTPKVKSGGPQATTPPGIRP